MSGQEGFEYPITGSFRAAYGSEDAAYSGTIVAALLLLLPLRYAYLRLCGINAVLAVVICHAAVLALAAAVFFVIRKVLRGREYSYYADGIKLTVSGHGGKRIFHYNKVLDVCITPCAAFGIKRGYDVSILSADSGGYFRIITKNPLHDTPFYILQQNADARVIKAGDNTRGEKNALICKSSFRTPYRGEALLLAAGFAGMLLFAIAVSVLVIFLREFRAESFHVSDMTIEDFLKSGGSYLSGLLMLDAVKSFSDFVVDLGLPILAAGVL